MRKVVTWKIRHKIDGEWVLREVIERREVNSLGFYLVYLQCMGRTPTGTKDSCLNRADEVSSGLISQAET